MTPVQLSLAVLFPVLLMLGVPIYASLGLTGFAIAYFTNSPMVFASQTILNGVNQYPLLAIPAFILAGNLMEQGGITQHIVGIFRHLFGHIRGSLGMVTIFSCMFFAAISGSGPGTAAAIGAIMIPAMVRYGYPPAYAAAAAATGGTLGVLIPPSNPMIIYGLIANASIRDLFIAGVVPGVLVGLVLAGIAYVMARIHKIKTIDREGAAGWRQLFKRIWDGKFALALPALVLGGIYTGLFTPVEASIVAVVYALLVGNLVYRSLGWAQLKVAFERTHMISGALMIVVACSTLFARTITFERIPQGLVALFSDATSSPIGVLILINILLLIIGCFMETLSAIIILGPMLVPLVKSFGVDPVHFGIVLILNVEIAFLTPPLGVNLFVAAQIANISIEKMFMAVLPYIIGLLAMLGVITLVPELSLWLPRMLK
ncbi:MAG: TRAP transporter large permease [Burkholderiales bacterium]|nr:TRAP transporter large permease [Burkholderiales bacterium]